MPFHLTSNPPAHRRPPLRSRSLSCKSRPTCTLSLAHVSACKPENVMQVDTTLQLGLFVAVPLPQVPVSLKKSKSKTKSTSPKTIPNDINVIPFPTSAQTTPSTSSSASSTTSSHTSNSFKHHQKKEDTPTALSHSPPRKRARKGSISTSPPTSSRPSVPSARVRALAQRRPPTPTPDCWPDSADDDMGVGDKSPVHPSSAGLVVQQTNAEPNQQSSQGEKGHDVEKHSHPELPPYSLSPPPYSPAVTPITSPTPIPIHVPIPVVPPPPPPSSTTPSSSIPESSTPQSQPPRPLPVSSPPPPSSSISPPPQRRSRISSSELRFFIFLYRSVVSGLELRRQTRLNTQQVRRARDGSRREQHLDGVLVEDDDDDDLDVHVDHDDVKADTLDANEPTPSSLNEALEAQDALLALRLRGFLKWNGVDEWMLKVNSGSSSPSSSPPSSPTGVNPFLEDNRMDVDVQQQQQQTPLPMLSSRHLITVLRMRGTCGSNKQGGPIGLKFSKDKSKLRMCAFKAEGDD